MTYPKYEIPSYNLTKLTNEDWSKINYYKSRLTMEKINSNDIPIINWLKYPGFLCDYDTALKYVRLYHKFKLILYFRYYLR